VNQKAGNKHPRSMQNIYKHSAKYKVNNKTISTKNIECNIYFTGSIPMIWKMRTLTRYIKWIYNYIGITNKWVSQTPSHCPYICVGQWEYFLGMKAVKWWTRSPPFLGLSSEIETTKSSRVGESPSVIKQRDHYFVNCN